MNISGLDYNTTREKLILPEYGREVQKMVDYAIGLPTKAARQRCAESIIAVMGYMGPKVKDTIERKRKLWDHLAIISQFKLDIDWPYDISQAKTLSQRPQKVPYVTSKIPVRHYGRMVFELFDKLKTMPAGPERDKLAALTANQIKRNLMLWSHGAGDNERVVSDLARFTDGKIQLDLHKFTFDKMPQREPERKKKKR